MSTTQSKQWLTAAEAAVALNTSEATVHRAADRGRLTPVRQDGRVFYDVSEVEALAAERKVSGGEPGDMPAGEPITDGARLILALGASGTGGDKLTVARAELARIHREERRVATSLEITSVLSHEFGEGHGTVRKARSLMTRGVLPTVADDVDFQTLEEVLAGTTEQPAAASATRVS